MRQDEIEKLYGLYYKEILLYAFSLCKNMQNAEALTSDTFYKAILNADKLEIEMKYWLFKVCKNSFYDMLKKEKHFVEADPEKQSEPITEDILESIIRNETNKNLYRAIFNLDSPYKDCVLLHYFYGYSLKDIAVILGLSPGAVRTAIYRARLKLRKVLREPLR